MFLKTSGSLMPTAGELADQINATLGAGTVRLGNDPSLRINYWPTGVQAIDYLLQGGLPTGRIVEFYGDYSTLKTYVALRALGSVQQLGGSVAIVDTEHAWDADWAEELGVDTNAILVQWPDTAEDGIAMMEAMVRSHFDLIVWDSIASSQPKQYAEAKPGDDIAPAALARVMSNGLRRINSANRSTAVLALNQTRVNVGMTYGSKETTPGGRAMPFYASYRVRLTKAGKVTEAVKVHDGEKNVSGTRTIAMKIKATLEKSKLSKPFSETWFLYDLATGSIDDVMFLISQGLEHGLIVEHSKSKGPSYYEIPEVTEKPLYGLPKFKQFVIDNPEVIEWLTQEVMPESSVASPGNPDVPVKKKAGGRKRST